MPMSLDTLKGILEAEKKDALAGFNDSKLAQERSDAIDYYLGDMTRHMPALPDRSQAVSTDVADTIEGILPSLVEIFLSGEDVVMFEPVGQEDEEAARQETEYVGHVFMQQNDGFLNLYTMMKDALLSKVGVVKVWWEENEEEDRQTFRNLGEDAVALLMADKSLQIVSVEERADYAYGAG